MPIQAPEICEMLKEWPKRPVGSDAETEAREALMARLTGEYGVSVQEEGFVMPSSARLFICVTIIGLVGAVLMADRVPRFAFVASFILSLSYLAFLYGFGSPLSWLGSNMTTANLVAKKGSGDQVLILLANLDTRSALYTDQLHLQSKTWHYPAFSALIISLIVPLLFLVGVSAPSAVQYLAGALILLYGLFACFYGYEKGCGCLDGAVAAQVAAATALWRHMPENSDIRLVITTGGCVGHMGAQHYYQQHRDELMGRSVSVVALGSITSGALSCFMNQSRVPESLKGVAFGGGYNFGGSRRFGLNGAETFVLYSQEGKATPADDTVIAVLADRVESLSRELLAGT